HRIDLAAANGLQSFLRSAEALLDQSQLVLAHPMAGCARRLRGLPPGTRRGFFPAPHECGTHFLFSARLHNFAQRVLAALSLPFFSSARFNPTITLSRSDKSPIIRLTGTGNSLMSVGAAMIWSCAALSGCW